MDNYQTVITLLGSSGGVAKSILSILNKSAVDQRDPIHSYISGCTIHLIDIKQKEENYYSRLFPNLFKRFVFHQFDLKDSK